MLNLGIDIDNVISNFNEVLLKEYIEHDKSIGGNGIVDKDKYISKGMFGWSEEEQDSFYKNNIERIAKSLDTVKDSVKYINKLKEEGHKIYIITGRDNGDYSDPHTMTIDWLESKGVKYDKLIITNYHQLDKYLECKKHNIDIMIDDSKRIARKCVENGVNTLLMDTEYNKEENTIQRVYNWVEIYKYINEYKAGEIDGKQ